MQRDTIDEIKSLHTTLCCSWTVVGLVKRRQTCSTKHHLCFREEFSNASINTQWLFEQNIPQCLLLFIQLSWLVHCGVKHQFNLPARRFITWIWCWNVVPQSRPFTANWHCY